MSQSLFQQMVFCNKALLNCMEVEIPMSQSLFQQMVFCNTEYEEGERDWVLVTILILVDGFLQSEVKVKYFQWIQVSQSLFQQMVFCNLKMKSISLQQQTSHNPYFSRWFSAIKQRVIIGFQRVQSQSLFQQMVFCNKIFRQFNDISRCHNPYFSRWFSAIA